MTFIPLSRLLVEGRAEHHPVAIRDGETLGFARFDRDVRAATQALRHLGPRRAALVCVDSYAFLTGLYAMLHAGVTVILPPNSQAGTIAGLRDSFDILVDDGFLREVGPGTCDLAPLDDSRPALEFYTSGSTGTPKRIVKALRLLERETAVIDGLWGETSGQGPVHATVSHQHVYGMTFKLLWPAASGRRFAAEMHEVWEPLLDRLTAETIVVSSPAHLGRLGGLPPLPPAHRPSRILSAGAPLAFADSAESETIFGVRPTEIFGSTETGAFATRQQYREDQPWQLLPGITAQIDPEDRLRLRSPFLPDEDWVETGDRAVCAPEGLRFLDRMDRLVKIEGKRVSLAEVERALIRLPWIADAAATALPGEPLRLAAAVVPSAEGRERLETLGSFRFGRLLRRALADTQEAAGSPKSWRFVDDLPVRHMGKRRQADLLALFGYMP